MKEIRPVSFHSISRHSCGHFKIYPRPQITNYCREDKIKIFPSIIPATLDRAKKIFLGIGSEAGRALRDSRRFPERAASRREKRREERGKRNPEAKLLRPFLSASQTAAKENTLYMPTTFPKCSVQFFAATSADPDERVTHDARANTHVPLPLPSLSFSLSLACKTQPVHVYDASVQGVCRESIALGV